MILTKFEKYFYKAEKSFIVLLEKKKYLTSDSSKNYF